MDWVGGLQNSWSSYDDDNWNVWGDVLSFTSNWENILDKMTSVLRTEFKNTLPVYVGEANEKAGSQYLRLDPVGSELVEYTVKSEIREFSVNIFLYFADRTNSRTALDAKLRLASRIEALMHDNVSMTLSDSTSLFNCRMESTTLDAEEDSVFYVVLWDFKGLYRGNLS